MSSYLIVFHFACVACILLSSSALYILFCHVYCFLHVNKTEVTTTPSTVADSEILVHCRSNIRHGSSTRRNHGRNTV